MSTKTQQCYYIRSTRFLRGAIIAHCIFTFLLVAQVTQTSIDVISVKEVTAKPFSQRLSPKSVTVTGGLGVLTTMAYGVPATRIRGLPGWTNGKTFEIQLTTATPFTPDEVPVLMKEVLRSRFDFSASFQEEEVPELIVTAGKELRISVAAPNDAPAIRGGRGAIAGAIAISARGVTLSQFFEMLSASSGQIFVDRTGLTDKYSFTLEYAPDMAAVPFTGDEPPATSSFYSALRDLGFKIARGRGKTTVLIVNHAQLPTPN